jgi:hypothetical protein
MRVEDRRLDTENGNNVMVQMQESVKSPVTELIQENQTETWNQFCCHSKHSEFMVLPTVVRFPHIKSLEHGPRCVVTN